MFILVGIQILLTRKSELILIDKEAGKIILTNLSIIKKESKEVQLSEIKKLILEITTLERRRRGTIYYRYEIELIQEEGRTIFELGRTGRVQTGVATPDQKMIDQAKQIAEFVGVPFECTLPLDTDYIPRELKEKMGLMQNETK